MKIYHLLSVFAAICLGVFAASAQNQEAQTPEQREKQLQEAIDKEVQRLTTMLDLEYWQEFYVDSTLRHDIPEMNKELEKMQAAKVENRDLYLVVQEVAAENRRFLQAFFHGRTVEQILEGRRKEGPGRP